MDITEDNNNSNKSTTTTNQERNPKLPATFDRWFWTPDYRRGVVTLFEKLNAGLNESQELIGFIRRRESFERTYAHQLKTSNPIDPLGFGYDDGASFLSVYKQLRSSQTDLAEAHINLARQLDRLVIAPFEVWSRAHQDRISKAIEQVEQVLARWENQVKEVVKLKLVYDTKTREADDAEEDSRFSPAGRSTHHQHHQDRHSSSSPSANPEKNRRPASSASNETYGQISKMVSEQAIGLGRAVSQKMRIKDGRVGFKAQSLNSEPEAQPKPPVEINLINSPQEEKPLPESPTETHPVLTPSEVEKSTEKQHNLTQNSGTTLLNIAGVIKPPVQWSLLFQKARDTVFKQSVKVPVLGTYHGAHSGEDLVIFFTSNLPELDGDADRAVELCRELSQHLSILRLIGEIGNKFIASQDAFYVWKPEAFSLHKLSSETAFEETLTELPDRRQQHSKTNSWSEPPSGLHHPPRTPNSAGLSFATNGFDELNNRHPAGFSKYFQTAVTQAAKGINELSATVGVSTTSSHELSGESRAERLRREAQSAEKAYSTCVVRLDHTRLMLEQTMSEYFQFLQRCELDRLRAAKAVIMGFNAALATLNPKMNKLATDAMVLNESFSPEGDVAALVERYRTGPFRPSPILFHSCRDHETRVNFGIDLSKWHNSQQVDQCEDFHDVPPVLTRLLNHLDKAYEKIPSDEERRKTWVYEVRLKSVHGLREVLNDPFKTLISDEQLDKVDAPLLAATVKLWLLELDPPPVHYSKYDDIKAIYPQRAGIEAPSVDARVDVLATLLSKLPRPHLMVIDAIACHLKNLFTSTAAKSSDDDEVYLTKIGLSFSRSLLRPKVENAMTLSDRFQPSFLIDLIKHYDRILPVAIAMRNKMMENEMGGKKLQRKSTRPVDLRVRRSELGIEGSVPDSKAQEILENQRRRVSKVELLDHPAKSPPAPSAVPPAESAAAAAADAGAPACQPVEPQSSPSEQQKGAEKAVEDGAPIGEIAAEESGQEEPGASAVAEDATDGAESGDEQTDAPFVTPSAGLDEPVDMPFVPPVAEAQEGGRAYGAPGELDEQDIPLSTKAALRRISSGERAQPSSLNRKRGVGTGSPKMRQSPKLAFVPSPAAPVAHKKSSPSVGSLRSQFESSSAGPASKRDSHAPVPNPKRDSHASAPSDAPALAANRYRRSAGPHKA